MNVIRFSSTILSGLALALLAACGPPPGALQHHDSGGGDAPSDAVSDAPPGDGACLPPDMVCSGACTPVASDPMNCGTCGHACSASETCIGGSCMTGGCTAPLMMCGSSCTNTNTDSRNCGSCGHVCGGGSCSGGVCGTTCSFPNQMCGSLCVDTSSDPSNCGTCGHICSSGVCNSGACASSCLSPNMMCGSICTNVTTDRNNCGFCGNACATGSNCSGGTCTATCSFPMVMCGTTCTNTSTDPFNCGSCGNACPSGETCSASSCTTTTDPTTPCATATSGLTRDCGWMVDSTYFCTPGASVTVGCNASCTPPLGSCTGDTIMRICTGSTTCTSATALASNDDSCGTGNYCSEVTFTCPSIGEYTVLTGAYSTTATGVTCNVAHN